MKWAKAFFDSLHLSWIGRFGGNIKDRDMYILWSIRIYPNSSFKLTRVNIIALRQLDCRFIFLPENKEE